MNIFIFMNNEKMIKNSIYLFFGLILIFSVAIQLIKVDYTKQISTNISSITQERNVALQSLKTKIVISCPVGYEFINGSCQNNNNELNEMPLSQTSNQIISIQKQMISMILEYSKYFSLIVLIIGIILFAISHDIKQIINPIIFAILINFLPFIINAFTF